MKESVVLSRIEFIDGWSCEATHFVVVFIVAGGFYIVAGVCFVFTSTLVLPGTSTIYNIYLSTTWLIDDIYNINIINIVLASDRVFHSTYTGAPVYSSTPSALSTTRTSTIQPRCISMATLTSAGRSTESDSIILEEEIDPNYNPTVEEINEYAKWLGMDLYL